MDKDKFTFIIPTRIDSHYQCSYLAIAIRQIQQFHPNNKIVLINDNSTIDIVSYLNHELTVNMNNITIKMCKYPGSAELIPYHDFLSNRYSDYAIILQDSFHLKQSLNLENITNDITFLWYATNHRLEWSKIQEPMTEYNIDNDIHVHDDLIVDFVNTHAHILIPKFLSYFNRIYHKKDRWIVCFGIMSIISHDFLTELHEKTGILNLVSQIQNKRHRMVMESVFSIACQYVLECSCSEIPIYDGLYYDGERSRLETHNFIKYVFNR